MACCRSLLEGFGGIEDDAIRYWGMISSNKAFFPDAAKRKH
jgi:hypothetical protein